ncbi:Uncharacterised protein [Mycobacteroides abscessus subsp. abscessus]|nr:Uncharacterised protein [Mycobacteroides abscessus subsp. abscessus]
MCSRSSRATSTCCLRTARLVSSAAGFSSDTSESRRTSIDAASAKRMPNERGSLADFLTGTAMVIMSITTSERRAYPRGASATGSGEECSNSVLTVPRAWREMMPSPVPPTTIIAAPDCSATSMRPSVNDSCTVTTVRTSMPSGMRDAPSASHSAAWFSRRSMYWSMPG